MDLEKDKITSHIESIQSLRKNISTISKCFRDENAAQYLSTIDNESAEYWKINTYGNALVKLRIILEDNFNVIETIGLVAVTRYIFELTIWLYLFEKDINYALIYKQRLLDGQKRQYIDTLEQYKREAKMLKELEVEDIEAITQSRQIINSKPNMSEKEATDVILKAQNKVDAKAARLFSIYSDEANINGYGFQAHLIETKLIPKVQADITSLQHQLDNFNNKNSSLLTGLLKCSNWAKMAEKVNMLHEYKFIYSNTSKLLHCSPMSMTTNQKKLEYSEIVIFLRYILTKTQDIIELSKKQPQYIKNSGA